MAFLRIRLVIQFAVCTAALAKYPVTAFSLRNPLRNMHEVGTLSQSVTKHRHVLSQFRAPNLQPHHT